jgi:hypothetical protein
MMSDSSSAGACADARLLRSPTERRRWPGIPLLPLGESESEEQPRRLQLDLRLIEERFNAPNPVPKLEPL